MIEKIRLATAEEIEEVKDSSNLTSACSVWKMGEITGVYRTAHELDPVHINGAPLTKVYKFLWGMENMLRGAGVKEYFYNVPADNLQYHKILEEMGAKKISTQPDFRFRMDL